MPTYMPAQPIFCSQTPGHIFMFQAQGRGQFPFNGRKISQIGTDRAPQNAFK